jgi:hypothetical protein
MNFLNRKLKILLIIIWVSIFAFSGLINKTDFVLFSIGSLISFLLTPTLNNYVKKENIVSRDKKIIRLEKELEKLKHETS